LVLSGKKNAHVFHAINGGSYSVREETQDEKEEKRFKKKEIDEIENEDTYDTYF